MNTTGAMNRIADVTCVGNGNYGSVDLTIPQASQMRPNVLHTEQMGLDWLSKISSELTALAVPFKRSTGPLFPGLRRIWWVDVNRMVPSLWATGCLEIFFTGRKIIHLSHAAGHCYQGAVTAMHELGHLHMDSDESHEVQRYDINLWHRKYKKPNEIKAWKWAKQQMAGDWTPEAERVALDCLNSYDIIMDEV